jgi:Spy/CpxP family protein refolding chaperone
MRSLPLLGALSLIVTAAGAVAAPPSPYAGQESRDIKALSAEEIDDLMNGRGMGLAKAGELNGYPGPAHVLDLAAALDLTPEQRRAVAAIKDRMSAAAKPLGTDLVDRERALDRQFADARITEPELRALTATIGELQAKLRAIHLNAHIETKRVLTPEQVARYAALRGYGIADPMPHDHNMKGHGG